VDNAPLAKTLMSGAARMGLPLDAASAEKLIGYQEELLRWNRRVNLVGRASTPAQVMEKHLLDSLAAAPELEGVSTLIDIGAGAGLPGIPLKVLRPQMEVTLVDSNGKKVAFMRHAIAKLALGPAIRVAQARAIGTPARERLPIVEATISRALAPLREWLTLAFSYVGAGGRVIAMLSGMEDSALAAAAEAAGATLCSARRYELPFSHARRTIAVFERPASPG
jgi:16S rRNA (guanine527-N7)-methyltransferase